jgi:hypothetical protein
MREVALAGLIPLWRTLREREVTALVTPALDYVGALELSPVDCRFDRDDQIGALGEGLRSFVSSLDDECTLLFLYRVHEDAWVDVEEYASVCAKAEPQALKDYVAARVRWLKARKLRRVSLTLFFSNAPLASGALTRGHLGLKLLFGNLKKITCEAHEKRLDALTTLRDRLASRLRQLGIQSRELSVSEIQALHYELLNPGRSKDRSVVQSDLSTSNGQRSTAPFRPRLVADTLWHPSTLRTEGTHLAEYSEAEQLCFENLREARGHFEQSGRFRRVVTLKVLPEGGTDYFAAESLFSLAAPGPDGDSEPFAYTLAVAVNVKPQGRARWLLSTQHGLVDSLKNAIPFLASKSVDKDAADQAKQESIGALFAELNEMSSKLVTLSVSLLLEAPTLAALDAQTEAARSAFNAAGNSELLIEDVSQVPAFLSMLPGSGPYQLRKKTCTSRNAGDFLPVFAPWRGTQRAACLMLTPDGGPFRFDLFDKSLATAHHGLVVADTGSGKSVTLGALTLDAMASGVEAILIDNGNSWKPLTELLGGIHIPVDIKTSLSPFVSYEEMLDEKGTLDAESVADVVSFIEVCLNEPARPGFDKLTVDLVSRAIRRCYEREFRLRPTDRPLISHFQKSILEFPGADGKDAHPDDRRVAEDIARRLSLFVGDGLYGPFLDRPSSLRFDARLLTFDLQNVAKSPTTKAVAMATIIQAVTHRAASRRARTLIEVDEGHEHLGQDDVGERFLAGCYRKMRKYDCAMWMISQRFSDFANCKAGEAIIGNAKIKIFLRHDGGHEPVIAHFNLPHRAGEAFRRLALKPGHYSDLLLMYGARTTTVRVALHPLAYWILTTDPDDRRLIDRAAEKNPDLSRAEILTGLASRFPHGAPRPNTRAANS